MQAFRASAAPVAAHGFAVIVPSRARIAATSIFGACRWLVLLLALCGGVNALAAEVATTDPVAENMLLLQTPSGGWSKHYREKKVDYTRSFDAAERAALHAPDRPDDATIDNKATTSEIAYLVQAHARTGNTAYLAAAERGVDYLLRAQYPNGGWPQYFPDRSLYRHQITLNDDAMVLVVGLLQDIAESRGDMALLTTRFGTRATAAAGGGIDCLLTLQVRIDGQPTIWAAQYDETTLQPGKARAYELPALAVSESVGVIRLLMRQPAPDTRIVAAVESAAAWREAHRMRDLALNRIDAPSQPSGKDVEVLAKPGASLWARFYDLQAQQPLFVDRDSQPVAFARMSNERRVGYAWYGTWPETLLAKELPRWRAAHSASALP